MSSESRPNSPQFEQVMGLLKEKRPGMEFEITWYTNDSPTNRYLNIEPWGYGPMLEPGLRCALVMGSKPDSQFYGTPLRWDEVDQNNVVSVDAYADEQRIIRHDGIIIWSNENSEEQLADLETLKRIL